MATGARIKVSLKDFFNRHYRKQIIKRQLLKIWQTKVVLQLASKITGCTGTVLFAAALKPQALRVIFPDGHLFNS